MNLLQQAPDHAGDIEKAGEADAPVSLSAGVIQESWRLFKEWRREERPAVFSNIVVFGLRLYVLSPPNLPLASPILASSFLASLSCPNPHSVVRLTHPPPGNRSSHVTQARLTQNHKPQTLNPKLPGGRSSFRFFVLFFSAFSWSAP